MGRRLAGLWLILVAVALAAGCAAPRFTYIADTSASTYFKVPYGWQKVDDSALFTALNGGRSASAPSGLWSVGYDAAAVPDAKHVLSPAVTHPFVLGLVVPLSASARASLTDERLADFFLPVTPAARQSAALQGFPLTGFRLLRDNLVTASQGIHGVKVIFDYRYPDHHVDTFGQVALTNPGKSEVYVLLVHCTATCYSQHLSQINTVMSSFTVRS
ncbi:MAG: hypothetical protein J2P34_05970 [Actinobacteria bacterium]|nr:hypothetical protein [Actinomycetota bacterium]